MITGEPMPVEKAAGDAVIGGTVNQTGSFLMRAEHVGEDTVLAQIVDMVAEAQRSRAPIQRVADTVAGVVRAGRRRWRPSSRSSPGHGWGPEPRLAYALVNAVAVLIIACPCALGLATPMSIMVGVGRGATEGVLIKNAEVARSAGEGRHARRRQDRHAHRGPAAADRTASPSANWPKTTCCGWPPPSSRTASIRWRAPSSKPPRSASSTLSEPADFDSVTGGGVSGNVDGRRVLVGTPAYLARTGRRRRSRNWTRDRRDASSRRPHGHVRRRRRPARRPAGRRRSDQGRPRPRPIRTLHELGLRRHHAHRRQRADGPGRRPAARHRRVSRPASSRSDKHERIKALRAAGRVVAMAGDGINDAPALAAADVGIAMGTGTDVAIESAGVTLVKGDLRGIVKAIRLSRHAMRNIRQNLFFAFVYNALGVPIAAGVLFPLFGSAAQPDDRRGGDELQFRVGRDQRAACFARQGWREQTGWSVPRSEGLGGQTTLFVPSRACHPIVKLMLSRIPSGERRAVGPRGTGRNPRRAFAFLPCRASKWHDFGGAATWSDSTGVSGRKILRFGHVKTEAKLTRNDLRRRVLRAHPRPGVGGWDRAPWKSWGTMRTHLRIMV